MKKALEIGMAALLPLAMDVWPALAMDESSLDAGRFGSVYLYRKRPQPGHVVLFVSGQGGWNLGVVELARTPAGLFQKSDERILGDGDFVETVLSEARDAL